MDIHLRYAAPVVVLSTRDREMRLTPDQIAFVIDRAVKCPGVADALHALRRRERENTIDPNYP